MVSLKEFVKVFHTLSCFIVLSSASVYAQTLDIPITECSGSSESKVSCSRDLGDGTTQTGSGWCKCSRGMWTGGCLLAEATYTEERLKGAQCRTCTVPRVTRCCGGYNCHIDDESPSCGAWRPCVGLEPSECTSGQTEYKPKGDCGTSSRTCCSNGTWSDWDGECINCSLNQCWNGTICEAQGTLSRPCSGNVTGATGGTQTRSATCISGSGWSYGNWSSSNCTYSGGGSSCICEPTEHLVRYSNGDCCCENNGCGKTFPNGTMGFCKCKGEGTEIGRLTWQKAGTSCRSKSACGEGSCRGSCSTSGSECTTWVNNGMSAVSQGCAHSDTGDRGICQHYTCL